MDPVSSDGLPSFTERLNQLIEVSPFRSNVELVQALQRVDLEVTPAYISMLRSGRITNPSARHVHGLSLAFGVDPRVWFDARVATIEIERLLRVDLAGPDDQKGR